MTATLPRLISAIRLDGGRLCLDFVNTIHDRFAADTEDYISTPERYMQWARRAGAPGPGEDAAVSFQQSRSLTFLPPTPFTGRVARSAGRGLRKSHIQPKLASHLAGEADRLMTDVRVLRDAVYRLLSARVDQAPLPADALSVANHWLILARQSQVLDENGLLTWRAEPGDLRLPLKCIALDVVDTLADARAGKLKLKRCANHTSCGWLFADTSKNGRRRWCAMETCGTMSKMATRRVSNTVRHPITFDRPLH